MTALVLIIFIATSYKKMFRQEQVYPSKVITVWVPCPGEASDCIQQLAGQ